MAQPNSLHFPGPYFQNCLANLELSAFDAQSIFSGIELHKTEKSIAVRFRMKSATEWREQTRALERETGAI
jgi:hypothetical protein